MNKKLHFIFVLAILLQTNLYSQYKYDSPLDIPLVLSANFGELRPNHFHSGIDIKTQGVINKKVYSIDDGYISRISVSPSGYGLAIYIDHPATGHTSVYGHLNSFSSKIADYVQQQQYEKESFTVNLYPDKTLFPVKKGEFIAYSGNTGSSGGPHLHFEIRDAQSEQALDPLLFYKERISDTISPQLRGITLYPIAGEGVINNSPQELRQNITVQKKGGYTPFPTDIKAWGKIGIGICTYDKMNGTSNIFGVKSVKLFCDEKEIAFFHITAINFELTRMINSLIDYDYWAQKKSFYMRSFIEPGNKLPLYKTINDGYLTIDQEKTYNLRYELEDIYNNKTTYQFTITGKIQNIPRHKLCSQFMVWDQDNYYVSEPFSLTIPKGCLYNNLCFILQQKPSQLYSSNIYTVNDLNVPLQDYAFLKIKLNKDSIQTKSQYGIVRLKGNHKYWEGGIYENGYVTARIRELGNDYTVSFDNEAPKITPLQPEKWVVNRAIKIKLTDNLSGIKSYKGTIDGKFALFEHDVKSSIYTYKFDNQRLKTGEEHRLVFIATDGVGNTTSYEFKFRY